MKVQQTANPPVTVKSGQLQVPNIDGAIPVPPVSAPIIDIP